MIRIATLILALFCSLPLQAKEYYISPEGKNNNPGSEEKPLATISKAAKLLKPGDTLYLLEGRYSSLQEFSELEGTKDKPITITAAEDAKVIFDGTDTLEGIWEPLNHGNPQLQEAQWARIGKREVYSMKLESDIYALIYDGRLMSDARWPNARWDDPWRLDRYMVLRRASEKSTKGILHDSLPTENALEESSAWLHYDREKLKHRNEMLADTGLDFTGSIALMSHTWGSWATRVLKHEAGSSYFEYDTEFNNSGSIQHEAQGFLNNRIGWKTAANKFTRSSHSGIHFFLTGLPALDIEEEWWYDQESGTLYFISPDGKAPVPGKAQGKRRDFMLSAKRCAHIHIKNIIFYGAAAALNNCNNSTLENCDFKFGSYNKFVLGDFDIPATTRIENTNDDTLHGNALINCKFTYLDGNAFEGRSDGLTIDNVLIYRTQQTTLGLDSRSMSINSPLLVRRVTINDVGASVGIKGGGIDSIYELNNIMRFGGLQYDGASLQMGGREKFIYRYNWSHDHPKRSYRFDAGSYPERSNAFGEMSYNVAWNTPGGFAIKGDDHLIHNNLLIGDGGFELFNMKRWAGKNERTLVANNIVPFMSAGTNDWNKPVVRKSAENASPQTSDTYWLKETIVPDSHPRIIGNGSSKFDDGNKPGSRFSPLLATLKNNYHKDAYALLRDPDNLDFRPKDNSPIIDSGHTITRHDVPWKTVPITGSDRTIGKAPDIGPYEFGSDSYWIPGFKHAHASTPVPPNNSQTAKPDCDLMWLGGYNAKEHKLYLGTGPDSLHYHSTFTGDHNVFDPGTDLTAGETYYWRVDAVTEKKTITGPVWRFTVIDLP